MDVLNSPNHLNLSEGAIKSEVSGMAGDWAFVQCDRFVENSNFFDHPEEKVISSKFYVMISYVTKIILQIAQKKHSNCSICGKHILSRRT